MEVQAKKSTARSFYTNLTHQLAVSIENEQLAERAGRCGWSKRCHINVAVFVCGDTFRVRVACRQGSELFDLTAIPSSSLKREQHKRGQQGNTDKAKQRHLDTHPFVV